MPIYLADLQQHLIIKEIRGNDKIKAHLENLGFIEGEDIMLISRINDNVIVKLKGVSLAITNQLAKRIIV